MAAKIKNSKGFSLLEILLVLGIVGVISTFAISISFSLKNMANVNDSRQSMKLIAAKAKDYYRGHGSLPAYASTDRVPIDAKYLDLEQKYRMDGWGQFFYYAVSSTINTISVDSKSFAGVVISGGPDQTITSGTSSPYATAGDDILMPINVSREAVQIALEELKVLQSKVNAFDAIFEGVDNDGDGSIDEGDTDLAAPGPTYCLNLPAPSYLTSCPPTSWNEADQPTDVDRVDPNCGSSTLDQIELTPTSYSCNTTYDYTSIDSAITAGNALSAIVGFYSLPTSLLIDPWNKPYFWGQNGLAFTDTSTTNTSISSDDIHYHKFFSAGPNGLTGFDAANVTDDITP